MANSPAPPLVLHEGEEDLLREWVRSSTIKAGLAKRARIVLLAADGLANTHIAELTGASVVTVLKWRARYGESGIAGLGDDPRSGRPKQLDHFDIVTTTLMSIRRFEGHPILPPGTTDIAFGSQGWWRWGPPAPTAYFPTGPVLPVLAYCECRYRPRWCYAQCDP